MRKMILSALFFTGLAIPAETSSLHVLRGLFCNTEAQIEESLKFMATGLSPRLAAEMVNRENVACVLADEVRYMVVQPVKLRKSIDGFGLIKYQASLVGVLVGDNVRPIEPPVNIYFLTPQRLEGATTAGGA
jgi:hypothetical protein